MTTYNKASMLCELCQQEIDGERKLNCLSCDNNGAGKCDRDECPTYTTYLNSSQQCVSCQMNIGEVRIHGEISDIETGVNCIACDFNGKDKCDVTGCPSLLTHYDTSINMCTALCKLS